MYDLLVEFENYIVGGDDHSDYAIHCPGLPGADISDIQTSLF